VCGHRISGVALAGIAGSHGAAEPPVTCARLRAPPTLEQDPDVLDTWFSSGLWPFSTMAGLDHN